MYTGGIHVPNMIFNIYIPHPFISIYFPKQYAISFVFDFKVQCQLKYTFYPQYNFMSSCIVSIIIAARIFKTNENIILDI